MGRHSVAARKPIPFHILPFCPCALCPVRPICPICPFAHLPIFPFPEMNIVANILQTFFECLYFYTVTFCLAIHLNINSEITETKL